MIMGRARRARPAVFGRPRRASAGFRLAVTATLLAALVCAMVLADRGAFTAGPPPAVLTQP